MCAIQASSLPTSAFQTINVQSQKSSVPLPAKAKQVTKPSSQQKPKQSRDEKRRKWAKKSRPAVKPSLLAIPSRIYTSACCQAPATKPKAGAQEMQRDPESGKSKSQSKGLGKWRCSQCGKTCIVSCKKKEIENVNSIESDKQKVWKADSDRVGGKE
jgi:hypothetical protein